MAKQISDEVKEKMKAAESAIEQIKSRFGDGAIMKFGESKTMEVDAVSTGCLSLDIALGVGGVPRGRIIEIYGPEASGKTTLAQHVVAEVQKLGGIAAFVDAEHALDRDYARKIGVKVDELLISQPDARRASAGNRRDTRSLKCGWCNRDRLSRRLGAQSGNWRRYGWFTYGSPS